MEENRRLLKAAITSDTLETGGRLNPQQANQFIDYMIDQTDFLREVRVVRMDNPTYELDEIGIANRLIRRAVEAQEPTETAGITTGRKQLNTVEVILAADISIRLLEDNIERAALEDHIARLLSQQFGNDTLDLAINGDTGATVTSGTTTSPDPFLSIDDGWIKLAKASAKTNKVDTNGSQDYKGVVFPQLLAALPNQWKANKGQLRFICAPEVVEAYIDQLALRQTALGDDVLVSGRPPMFKGIQLRPVNFWPADVVILTNPQNLALGIQRQMTVDRMRVPRKRIYEYTFTARADFAAIVKDEALAIAYDIA